MDHRGPKPRHLRGVDDAVDQVARRIAFEEAHPEYKGRITCGEQFRWRALPEGSVIAVESDDLKALLDELERRLRST